MSAEDWRTGQLGEICEIVIGGTPSRAQGKYWAGEGQEGHPWVSIRDLKGKKVSFTLEQITDAGAKNSNVKLVPKGALLLSFKLTIGRVAFAGTDLYTNEAIAALKNCTLDKDFLYYGLQQWDLLAEVDQAIKGATLNKKKLNVVNIKFPTNIDKQTKIAQVLTTVDNAIAQTEALIAKYGRVRTGLMQDLLTKGIDEQGNIRSEGTHAFKDSSLGRIPLEWDVEQLGNIVESMIDGPFGSNLKTEHYVTEPGVRVIRLQNIGNGKFKDTDAAYISERHAESLRRHEVHGGDLLVASMGDENHPIARACTYPLTLPNAINKADCFRIRFKPKRALQRYVMHVFNSETTREDINIHVQGVTRNRVNLTTLKEIRLRVPSVIEQCRIAEVIDNCDAKIQESETSVKKLQSVKIGLMQDLLTGKVSVAALLSGVVQDKREVAL